MKNFSAIATVSLLLLAASGMRAQTVPASLGQSSAVMPAQLQNVGFEPQLNAQIPLDLAFTDETGTAVQLRDYFKQKPVVLALVYYGCPMLCNQVEQGVVGALRMLVVHTRARLRSGLRQFRSARIGGYGRTEKTERAQTFWQAGNGGGLAFPDRQQGKYRQRHPAPPTSATLSMPKRISSRTPAASWC